MDKQQLTEILDELDDALVKVFPAALPIKAMLVGGACLVFAGVISRPTKDIDCIIFDLMGSTEENSLIFTTPLATKVRRVITAVGAKHGFRGKEKLFFNDDASPFLLELSDNELPPMRLFREYQKIHLYMPDNLEYILACKLMAGRADKDFSDIAALCQLLHIQTQGEAQAIVDRYFPSRIDQRVHLLPATLNRFFPL